MERKVNKFDKNYFDEKHEGHPEDDRNTDVKPVLVTLHLARNRPLQNLINLH